MDSQPHSHLLGREGRLEMINNRPHLRDEASIKIPKVWGSESSQIDEHMEVLGVGVNGNSTPSHNLTLCISSMRYSAVSFMIDFVI